MVGAFGTACHYLVLLGLVQVASLEPTIATALGYSVGAVVNYVLNRRVTFTSDRAHRVAVPRYMVLLLLGFFVNTLTMAMMTELAHVHYFLSQIVATGIVLMMNFLLSRIWVFGVEP
jgi:putative flippase GtrA